MAEGIFIILMICVFYFVYRINADGGSSGGGGLLGIGGMGGLGGGAEGRLHLVATKYGVTLRNTYLIHGGGYSQHGNPDYVYGFSGVDKAGVEVSGQIRIGAYGGGTMTFDNSGAGARAARALGRLSEEEQLDETTLDLDEQVRREVARRLDTLQANRDAFMANDTDGDGLVDADEWAAARARIEEQVRLELGEAQPSAPEAPEPAVEPAEPAAAKPAKADEPVADDGHW